MKWIKNGNQLINMLHVSEIKIVEERNHKVLFYDNESRRILALEHKDIEKAEKTLEAIAMFLEHQHAVIMAMAPTNEEEL